LYKLSDIVEKLRGDPSSTDENRNGLAALIFGNLTENQKKIAFRMSFILLTNSNFDISFNLNILAASSFIPSVKAPPKSRSPHLLLNVLIANRQLVDKIAKSYRTKKKITKSKSNAIIKKEIAN
jgi:hypothetical protein